MVTVINVESISKKYLINHETKISTRTLKERISNAFTHFNNSNSNNSLEEFWALKDISFSIKQGQRVGIVGLNGSGKSTLLKILSRITQPTAGRATIRGRVASLLEVGTGFHHELTGRENIFLNGAILGMHHKEIRKKFDAIVDFSEIGKFLDTPVKRYSSGMYVRLAFAVAAHLEPEILIVDEVLAVGDASFQGKCLRKMKSIGDRETTILFVSHNINAVRDLCESALLLDSGKLVRYGPINSVIEEYSKKIYQVSFEALDKRTDRQGSGDIIFNSFITMKRNIPDSNFAIGEDISLKIIAQNNITCSISNLKIGVGINDNFGQRITSIYHEFKRDQISQLTSHITINIDIKNLSLTPGGYQFTLFCMTDNQIADLVENVSFIKIHYPHHMREGELQIEKAQGVFLLDYAIRLS